MGRLLRERIGEKANRREGSAGPRGAAGLRLPLITLQLESKLLSAKCDPTGMGGGVLLLAGTIAVIVLLRRRKAGL